MSTLREANAQIGFSRIYIAGRASLQAARAGGGGRGGERGGGCWGGGGGAVPTFAYVYTRAYTRTYTHRLAKRSDDNRGTKRRRVGQPKEEIKRRHISERR